MAPFFDFMPAMDDGLGQHAPSSGIVPIPAQATAVGAAQVRPRASGDTCVLLGAESRAGVSPPWKEFSSLFRRPSRGFHKQSTTTEWTGFKYPW